MNEFALQKQPQSLIAIDPSAVAAAESAKARIQAAYIMALQKPRMEDQSRARILAACKRPAFAERVEFSKPVAGRKIKGPSIRFAELALREWENILSDISVVYEDDHTKRIRVGILDLETNANFTKEITIKKTVERRKAEGREIVGKRLNTKGDTVFIVAATEDELNNKENALISKTIRNEGLRLIPSDIIDEAIEVASQTMRNRDAKDPQAEKKKVMDAFSSIGIQPKDIEAYLEHSLDSISPAELQDLRGVYRAIRDGEQKWSDYVKKTRAPDATAEKLNGLKKGPEKPAAIDDGHAEVEKPWYDPDNWIKLKEPGYPTFIHNNKHRRDEIPLGVKCVFKGKTYWIGRAIEAKWEGMFTEPFPWAEADTQQETTETETTGKTKKDELLDAILLNYSSAEIEGAQDELGIVVGVNNVGTLSEEAMQVLLNKLSQ